MTGRQLGLPDDVLLGAELDWKMLVGRDAEAIGTAKLRPVGGERRVGDEQCQWEKLPHWLTAYQVTGHGRKRPPASGIGGRSKGRPEVCDTGRPQVFISFSLALMPRSAMGTEQDLLLAKAPVRYEKEQTERRI
jgi:hypothetical protein